MDEYAGKLKLKACRNCGRTFVPESLVKHEKSCKNIQKQRKVFDTSKQRVTEDLSLRQIKAAQKKIVKKPKSHWKEQHEEFINNIQSAKGAQKAMARGEPLPPPPPPSVNRDYVQCPHCDRRFNEKAAERHIGFCKEQQKRLTAKREPTAQEKARAAAKGYQPPKPKLRGGPGETPSSGGGYSSGASRGGYSSGPVGGTRGGRSPAVTTNKRSDMGSAPGVGGYSSGSGAGYSTRGRAPPGGATGAAKGRPSPSSQTYQGRYAR